MKNEFSMTIDLRTATAEQLAEYVASRMTGHHISEWHTARDLMTDLNLIAAAMPPGWYWTRERTRYDKYWCAEKEDQAGLVNVDDTGSETTDRLRLAALAWEAQSKEHRQ